MRIGHTQRRCAVYSMLLQPRTERLLSEKSKRKSLPHQRFKDILLFILTHFRPFVKRIFIICFRKFREIHGKFANAENMCYNVKKQISQIPERRLLIWKPKQF